MIRKRTPGILGSFFRWYNMKKRPFLMASLVVGGLFLFFLLVIITAGLFPFRSMSVSVGNKIAVLEVEGPITDSLGIIEQIKEYRNASSIKSVIMRIDSPGGGVGPSQEIYAELKKLAAQKPLIVSMGAVAASGGYYLAVAGDKIFANPGTITGSIGVIMSFPNYRDLMDNVGIKMETVKSGQFKDTGSSSGRFSEEDRFLLQGLIDDVHQQFVTTISKERNLPIERLQPYVDGRIMTGQQAKEYGLIDELGTFYDAVAYAGQLSGLGTDPDLLYPEPEPTNFFDRYLQSALSKYLGVEGSAGQINGPAYFWNGQ